MQGGDILQRFGNPKASKRGDSFDQTLFVQHGATFLDGVPGQGNILVFNNGRAPDRMWTTIDEFALPPGAEEPTVTAKCQSVVSQL